MERLLVLRRPEMAGLAEADIHPLAQNVKRRHALRGVQRVMDRGEHDADAEAHRAGAPADRRGALLCDHTGRK